MRSPAIRCATASSSVRRRPSLDTELGQALSEVEATKAQIAVCQRLRRVVAELVSGSDDLCQCRLGDGVSAARKKPASRNWSPRSKAGSHGS